MKNKYSNSEKQSVVDQYFSGASVSAITADTGIPRSTVYAWIKKAADLRSGKKEVSLKEHRLLENRAARL